MRGHLPEVGSGSIYDMPVTAASVARSVEQYLATCEGTAATVTCGDSPSAIIPGDEVAYECYTSGTPAQPMAIWVILKTGSWVYKGEG